MFSFDVNDKILVEIKMVLECIMSSNVPISKSIHFKECSGSRNAGWCKKEDNGFIVAINRNIVFEKDIKETIVHEILHTIDGCFGHNKKWKYYAFLCSKQLGIEIQTKGAVFMLGGNDNHVERSIKIKDIKPNKQIYYLKDLLQNDLNYLLSNINQICCYLSQDNRDYLFLYLRENAPQIWFDIKYAKIAKCLDCFASTKAKHILANNYLGGKYDYIITDYKQWVYFSNIWSLTKDYIKCGNRYTKIAKTNIA